VEVESDSLEIAHLCSGEEHIWNEATDVYVKIMSHVGATRNVDFSHWRRELNEIAHCIARECFNSKFFCSWIDEPPSFLLQTLLNNVTLVNY
jgi:hypothetical protein